VFHPVPSLAAHKDRRQDIAALQRAHGFRQERQSLAFFQFLANMAELHRVRNNEACESKMSSEKGLL
jgi:hypothetical protein